jgi:4-hydroxy-tetrahydrodipicolinate synthase
MRDYVELALNGQFEEAKKVSRELQPVRDVHEKWLREPWLRHKVIPIAQLKAWSDYLGLVGGRVRAPLLDLAAKQRDELQRDLDRVGLAQRHAARATASIA